MAVLASVRVEQVDAFAVDARLRAALVNVRLASNARVARYAQTVERVARIVALANDCLVGYAWIGGAIVDAHLAVDASESDGTLTLESAGQVDACRIV